MKTDIVGMPEGIGTKALHIGGVIASFLSEKAKEHGIDENKLMIDSIYGELRLIRYDKGAYEQWKVIETIKPRF